MSAISPPREDHECQEYAVAKLDLNSHPLAPFFREVTSEYQRSLDIRAAAEAKGEKSTHGDWSDVCTDHQHKAVIDEMDEYRMAIINDDVDGPHGEIAELPQMANVAGKRWMELHKDRQP